MKILILAGLALLLSSFLAEAVTPTGQVRVKLSGAESIQPWVGQKVTMVIELLAPGFFSGTPQFDFPEIPGVILVPPIGRPVLGSEEIDGSNYTVQRYEVLLFAQRPGSVAIPPFRIRFDYKSSPLDKTSLDQEVTTPKLDFAAKLPPSAEKLSTLICSENVTATETWHPEPKVAKVGDAFTRRIEFQAVGVPGMALPPFPQEKITGLGVYRKSPVVRDQSTSGTLTGVRREEITYVCEQPGRIVIPAVSLTWFNVGKQSLEKIELPQREINVAVNPQMASAQVQPHEAGFLKKNGWLALKVLLCLTAISFLAWLYPPWGWMARSYDFLRPVHLEPLNPPESRLS